MSFVGDEDDDFVLPNSNSKLSSLFRETLSLPPDSKSLTYTPPKKLGNQQQQVKQVSSTTKHQEILAAVAVTCYKLNNEKYEALPGKVGLALLGNSEKHFYSIILYLNKQKPLSSTKISKDFKFISQPDNFCTFYDDSGQNWAVLFDSADTIEKFVSEVEKVLAVLGSGLIIPEDTSKETRKEPKEIPKETNNVHSDTGVTFGLENRHDAEGSSKTKLISRMAKLGQPILPLKGAAVAEDSDSDIVPLSSTETEQEIVKPKKPLRPHMPSPLNQSAPAASASTSFNSLIFPPSHYSYVSGQQPVPMLPYPGPSLSYTAPPTGNYVNYYETLLSETRTQNSEIRMHLCRLMDKIDHLAQQKESSSSDVSEFKLNVSKLLGQSSHQTEQLAELLDRVNVSKSTTSNEEKGITAEKDKLTDYWCAERESLILSMKKVKEDNERLKSLLKNKAEEHYAALQQIECLEKENTTFRDGLNKRLSEESEKLKSTYEEENGRLITLLNDQKAEKEKLTTRYERELRDLKAKSTEDAEMLNDLRKKVEEKIREVSLAQQERASVEERLAQADQNLVIAKEELARTKKGVMLRPESKTEASVIDQVKVIMNKVYKEITKQFQSEGTYSFKDIKATVGAVIRDTTLKMVNEENDSELEQQTIQKLTVPEPISILNIENNEDVPGEGMKPPHQSPPSVDIPPKVTEVAEKNSPRAEYVQVEQDVREDVVAEEGIMLEKAYGEADEARLSGKLDQSVDSEERKSRSESFETTLQTSLETANSRYNQGDPIWKPDPPPLPPLRDLDDDEADWMS